MKLDAFGLVDIQVSESAPTEVTYVGSDPVESYHGAFQRRVRLTVAFIAAKLPAQSFAPVNSLTRWLHTMIYLRGGACGSTVVLPDQSQWAVQSYDIKMDATQMPRVCLELVGIHVPVAEGRVEMMGASPIAGLEEWIPKPMKINVGATDPYGLMQLTRKQIFDALERLVFNGVISSDALVKYETTGQVSPLVADRIKAYILKQETKPKLERKDAFWKK